MANGSPVGICSGNSKQKFALFPQANTNPEKSYEISKGELFRCLLSEKTTKEIGEAQANETSKILKEIDLKPKITHVETHKWLPVSSNEKDNIFVVFQTTSRKKDRQQYWWSLDESTTESVTLQRSHEKLAVKNQFKGKNRYQVESIAEGLKGKGSVKDLLIILWIHFVIDLKCQSFLSRCESFIPLVMKKITETFYEYPQNYFTYSALSSEEINPQMEEIINFLTNVTTWHPLLCLTYLGDIHQFDQVLEKGFLKNKIDGIYNRLTLLNAAIFFCKTGMVKHVLEKKKANARKRDQAERNALHMAALFTDEEEIIKLLLSFQIKVDARDKSGMTALHYAVISSNLTVARHLMDYGADLKKLDPTGHSPLHLAAHYAKNSQILELLLTKVKIDECDLDGITALHSAAIASNAVSARCLIERGADINRVEKRGRTPVHVAATFAKNMGFFNIFLTNEKADLECCDERKLTVLDYAKINHQHGLAKEIVSGIEKKINDKRRRAKWIPGLQLCISGAYKLKLLFGNVTENIIGSIPAMGLLYGGESKPKFLFVPDAEKPDLDHEISEPALFRFLLNDETLELLENTEDEIPEMLDVLKDINKESKIIEFNIKQSSVGMIGELHGAFHVFIVFETYKAGGFWWWSLEKIRDYIVLQRSRNKKKVEYLCCGEPRKKVEQHRYFTGSGTIKDVFALIWSHQIISEKYNIFNNSQSFVTFVSQHITGYEYESPLPKSGRDKQMLDLINVLRACSDWPPLFTLILMENINLIDKIVARSKYDIDATYKGTTPLHFAILLEKTKMVQHLLKPPMTDPTTRNDQGRNALHVAAKTTMKAAIFDLLLAHDKVNLGDVDGKGQTALHLAASVSNVIAAQKLLERGADPNIFDNKGLSPLLVAAQQRDGSPVIDLMLEAKKVKGLGNVNDQNEDGLTALHYAAFASNEITGEHVIKKGADPNSRTNFDVSPLHVAAMYAKDMRIIDLLLQNINEGDIQQYRNDEKLFFLARHNVHGLEVEIGDRLFQKGLERPSTKIDEVTEESDEVTEESDEETQLFSAIRANNVDGVRCLLERGADPTRRNIKGYTPFQMAVINARDSEILNLLLKLDKTRNFGQITALHMAIAASNLIAARFLLSMRYINPNAPDENGATPLHWAALNANDMDIVKLLLNHPNVDVDSFDDSGRNALDYAMKNKNGLGERIANKFTCLTRYGRSRKVDNVSSDDIKTIEEKIAKISGERLLSAIKESDVEIVRLLLKNGVDINARGEKGENALHMASRYAKTTDLIDFILEKGEFNINGVDNHENTPLHYAISGTNCTKNTRHLIEKGANPNISNKKGNTLLYFAASNAMETIRLILENEQVDINHINKDGETALHYAIRAKNVDIARYLLENGADPTIRDHGGNTLFHFAAQILTDMDVLGIMLVKEKKIEIDEGNKFGSTALHVAIVWSNVKAAHFLLSNGANPNVADEDGKTPLHLAVMFAIDMDIVELLLNHKDTDVNCLDSGKRNALYFAKRNMYGHGERIVKLLKEKDVVCQTENSLNDEKVKNGVTFENIVKGILEKAIVYSNVGMARFLIRIGADLSTVTWGKGMNALHVASKYAKTTEILDVILATSQCDINGCDVLNEATALHHALGAQNMTTTRYLLKKGANPTKRDKKGITPLHLAAVHATTDIISLILMILKTKHFYNIDYRDVNGRTPLHYAILANNVITARYLLEKKADLTIRDDKGSTPFHIAAGVDKDSEIINLLLANKQVDIGETTSQFEKKKIKKKIEIDEKNKLGWTALHLAIGKSNVTAARFLLSNGANPNVADEDGKTPLHVAAYCADTTDVIKLILEKEEVDINDRDGGGQTALHYAVPAKRVNNVRYLLKKGADPTLSDNKGNTPFHLGAAFIRETDILDLCLDKLDIDHRNKSGLTALHMATMESNTAAAGFLLAKGANPNVADQNGVTPLHFAAYFAKDIDIVKLLVHHKDSNSNHLDNKGNNALHYAMDNLHGLGDAIVNLLREKRAPKAKGNNHEPKNIAALAPAGGIKEDSDTKTVPSLIEDGQSMPQSVTINARRLIKMGGDPGTSADQKAATESPLFTWKREMENQSILSSYYSILLRTTTVNCVDTLLSLELETKNKD